MKKYFLSLIPLAVVFLFSFCGKKGPIQPPVPKIPQAIKRMRVTQRGNVLILGWNNPMAYLDGSPLTEISEVEIWLFIEKGESVKEESQVGMRAFLKGARLAESIRKDELSDYRHYISDMPFAFYYFHRLAEADLTLRRFIFGFVIKDRKRRKSGFSDLIFFIPHKVPLPPHHPRAVAFKDRVEISWEPPEANIDKSSPPQLLGYNVYRFGEGGKELRISTNLIKERKFDDKDIIVGKTYRYLVRASLDENPPFIESDNSEIVEILVEDTFPPVPPTGLISIAGENMIALSWDMVQEEDLAGYRVWKRTEGEEEYTLLTPQPLWENSYNDMTVEKNITHYYCITAVDKTGNESEKSEPVSDIIREGFS